MRQDASTGELAGDKTTGSGDASEVPADILHVKVWSPFQVYYDGEARSISGVNGTGPFDILPRHRNFIAIVKPCNLVLQTNEGEIIIRISGGVMQVHRNKAVVFLEV